jgi:carbonic anhydrase
MQQLVDGFRRFREAYFEQHRGLFASLASQGQQPKTLLIGCSDSRVDPALIFDAQPGDLFVLRNVANLVPPYAPDEGCHGTSAALEFAVRDLEVAHIVVLGHAKCGGVHALLTQEEKGKSDFIAGWMKVARTARDRALALTLSSGQSMEAAQKVCEHETVAISLANLMTFPWIRERVQAGQMALHGLWFDMEDGSLFHLDPHTNTFQKI